MSAKFLIISLIFFSLEITQSYSTEQFQYFLHRVEEVNSVVIEADKLKQQTKNDVTYRLPNDTLPLEYDLTLKTWIHESNFNFTGNVVIKLLIVEDTTTIKLHYRRTTIVSATLLTANGESILSDDDFHLEIEEEFIVVTARQTLIKGTIYVLDIHYNGVLREDNVGFYRSYYTDENGDTVWIATTQFSPTDARHAFPCYDEPGIKAIYNIKIHHDESYHAISNMPGERSGTDVDGFVITTFQTTPLMQTYILGFTISKFDSIADLSTDIPHRVYARPATIKSGNALFGLNTGLQILQKHEELFGLKYQLPKLDQVAIPDFYFNAMENWGLVTYREEIVLINSTHSPLRQKQRSATVISHELSHMYFGNLVSPKWWQYLWLKEGFATFFEYYTASLVYPEWRLMELFILDKLQNVFTSDSYATTRAMTYTVNSPAEVSAVFDNISYDKAGCVLRMIMHAMGMETFFKGLHYYLEEMAYQGAIPADYYRSLQKAIDETPALDLNINTIYESWALQGGYPVLHVSRQITEEKMVLLLSQEQYWSKDTEIKTNSLWWIPYNVATSKSPNFESTNPDGWLSQREATLTLDSVVGSDDWIVLNKQQTGYYRVNYENSMWSLIGKQLKTNASVIHSNNRGQLIDDAFSLARSKHLDYDIVLDFIEFLKDEVDYVPWAAANTGLRYMKQMLSASEHYNEFQTFVGNIIENLYEKIGFNDPDTDLYFSKLVRNIAIEWACQLNISDCIEKSQTTLQEHLLSNSHISPDTKSAIYCIGVSHGSADTYANLWLKFLKSKDQYERSLIISALGCSLDPAEIDSFLLKSIVDNPDIRHQEKSRILTAVISNDDIGIEKAIDFISLNHVTIRQKYDRLSAISTAVIAISKKINTPNQFEKFIGLLDQLQTDYISDAAYTLSKTTCEENLKWIDMNGDLILNWMQTKNTGSHLFGSFYVLFVTLLVNLLIQNKYFK